MTEAQRMRAVATSPDSEFNDLKAAIDYHPRLVARNPALSLELVINPAALATLSVRQLAMLVAYEEAPEPLVELAVRRVMEAPRGNGDIARALLTNRVLAAQHVKHAVWALSESRDLSETSLFHRWRYRDQPVGQPVEHVERALTRMRLVQISEGLRSSNLVNSLVPRVYLRNRVDGVEASARWVAHLPLTAPEVLAYMGQLTELSMLRDTLALHKRAPASMLTAFLGDPWVKQAIVIKHANLPATVRQGIIDAGQPAQIALLAANPGLSSDQQMQLFRSGDVTLLPTLAENPGLCPEPARYIAALHNEELCLLLVEQDELADEVVEELMQCRHDTVKYALARKWSAATERVWRKKGVGVRSRRRRGDPEPEEDPHPARGADRDNRAQRTVPESGKVTAPDALLKLDLAEQLLVATARNVDEQTLDTLGGSIDAVVRLAVAAHPNTSNETRAWLATDTDVRVARAATEAPSLPV